MARKKAAKKKAAPRADTRKNVERVAPRDAVSTETRRKRSEQAAQPSKAEEAKEADSPAPAPADTTPQEEVENDA